MYASQNSEYYKDSKMKHQLGCSLKDKVAINFWYNRNCHDVQNISIEEVQVLILRVNVRYTVC